MTSNFNPLYFSKLTDILSYLYFNYLYTTFTILLALLILLK